MIRTAMGAVAASCRSVLLTSVPRHNQKILPPEGVLV
jgi:MFS-type transporter involved in bile tolerance (Atg22 family)